MLEADLSALLSYRIPFAMVTTVNLTGDKRQHICEGLSSQG